MRLTKVVFKSPVDGIFGESVQALATGESPTIRTVAAMEVTPLGLLVTRHDGVRRWVPAETCMVGDVEEEANPIAELEAKTAAVEGGVSGVAKTARAKAR